ncbi:endonuclease/exonuclease/phosphatase family protein [Thermodesulfobacteriota bacterium]
MKSKAELWLVLLVLAGFLTAAAGTECPPVEEPETEVFSLMSANTTSGNYSEYEGPGIRIFQGLAPDVVLIQEFSYDGNLRDLVDEAFGTEFDYYVEPGDENLPNGVVSRFPILSSGQWVDAEVPDRDFAWAVIDIPGTIDLQVVSIHLKSGSGDAGIRSNQATAIKAYVANYFDPGHFIAVGGDLNIYNTSESAMDTFRTFLAADNHIPVDQDGNANTSEPRSKPYDWVMPNALLDAIHTTFTVGTDLFPEGLVFDSWVYPAPLPSPILYGDSHVTGMQHMAVMKAYEVTLPAEMVQ